MDYRISDTRKIIVLIVDYQELVCKAIGKMLHVDSRIVTLDAVSIDEGVFLTELARPDVILLNLGFGHQLVGDVRIVKPLFETIHPVLILVYTNTNDETFNAAALQIGAYRSIRLSSSARDVRETVCRAYDEMLATKMKHSPQNTASAGQVHIPPEINLLSLSELKVIFQVMQGHTNNEISEILGMPKDKVKFRISNILKKLRLKTRTELVLYIVKQRLISLPAVPHSSHSLNGGNTDVYEQLCTLNH